MAYLHGKMVLLFLSQSWKQTTAELWGSGGLGLAALPLFIPLGMNNNLSQAEFVSPSWQTVFLSLSPTMNFLIPFAPVVPLAVGARLSWLPLIPVPLLMSGTKPCQTFKERPRAADQPEQEVPNNCTLDWKAIFVWAVWRGECVSREKNETKGKWLGFVVPSTCHVYCCEEMGTSWS